MVDKEKKKEAVISVAEAAKLLGLTRAAIYKKIHNGQLRALPLNGRMGIRLAQIREDAPYVWTQKRKESIDRGVAKAVEEYGVTLRLLGKE